jgi:hypothetical protein
MLARGRDAEQAAAFGQCGMLEKRGSWNASVIGGGCGAEVDPRARWPQAARSIAKWDGTKMEWNQDGMMAMAHVPGIDSSTNHSNLSSQFL